MLTLTVRNVHRKASVLEQTINPRHFVRLMKCIISFLLILGLGMSEQVLSENLAIGKVYTPTLDKKSEILKCIGGEEDVCRSKESSTITSDIKEVIYPIGTSGFQTGTASDFLSFQQASWFLSEGGIAAVQLQLRPKAPETITLAGSWVFHDKAIRLHIENIGLYGLKIAMDGILHPEKNGYFMTGLLTVSVRGVTQVESVKLNLSEVTNPTPNDGFAPAIQEFRQKIDFEQTLLKNRTILSEPSKSIGGVPLPMNFDVKIMATVDGIELAPMEGQLLLRRAEGLPEPTIHLLLATEGAVVPGWSAWNTAIDEGVQPIDTITPDAQASSQTEQALSNTSIPSTRVIKQPGVEVTAEDGRIHVAISPAGTLREIVWNAKNNPEHPDETGMAYVEKGVIDLKIADEAFSGTIYAQGTVMGGKKTASTFVAKLSGERQGRAFVKGITHYIGPRPFDGRWHDSRLGILALQQQQNKVTGDFIGGGHIEGVITGPVADLAWQNPNGGAGRGFLSTTNSGLLVGLTWYDNDASAPEPVVAIQEMPQEKQKSELEIPTPKSDVEARELKLLGYDFYSSGKYQEAVNALDKVVNYFSNREKSVTDPATQAGYFLDQVLPIQTLIFSANAAGDYGKLVGALAMAVDIERKRGKSTGKTMDSYYLRRFQDQAEKNIKELSEHAETMALLAEAFERGIKNLSTVGIGISFEEALDKAGIKISSVLPNMPANQAGVMADDVLTTVDGVSIAGMNQEQASTLLRGEVGSPVTIQVIRNGKTLEMKMVRAPLNNLEPKRKDEIAQSLAGLRDIAGQIRDSYRLKAEQFKQELPKTTGLSAAFKALITEIDQRQKTIEEKRPVVIAFAERGLARSPIALGLLQRFVKQMQEMKEIGGKLNKEATARMLKLDQDVEEFKHNPDATELDKDILETSGTMIADFDLMTLSSRGRLRLVEQEAKFTEKDIADPAKAMVGLGQWLDNWRSKIATDAAKISSLHNSQLFYVNYVNTLIKMDLPEEALQASESARARAFADLLAARRRTTGELNPGSLSKGIFSYSSAPPLSLQEIKDIVAAQKGIVIEYFLLPDHSCPTENQEEKDCIAIWGVTSEGNTPEVKIKMIQVPVSIMQLNADINRLMELMAEGLASENKRLEVAGLLRRLNDKLIEPLEKHQLLPVDPEVETLVTVIPHGNLFSVPFAALLDGTDRYLVEKYALNYATALSVLKYTQANTPNANPINQRHFFALVNPDPLPKSEEDNEKIPLPPLLKTAEYFPNIASFYSPPEAREIYTGAEATGMVLREHAANADVLYFATHAEVKTDDPLSSFIALAKTKQHDGYFRVSEVSELNLRAELVVLAACETGRGELSSDGINGLSRAFTQAGASALLMSLWKVPEERTTLLMRGFHHYWLQEKQEKAASLRSAQKEFLKSETYRTQPNLWAGFVLFGSSN